MTYRLYKQQKKDLPRKGMVTVYETLERPLIEVLVEMEHTGIKVDPIILKKMSEDFAQRLQNQAGDIYRLAGNEFNIASPKQLGEILLTNSHCQAEKKQKPALMQLVQKSWRI